MFENYELRKDNINKLLQKYNIKDIEECIDICKSYDLDIYNQVKNIQKICFEDACYAYIIGASIALKQKIKSASEACNYIGEALQAFCVDGSVSDNRKIGLGHGELAARLLDERTECFAFLAGHESFAAAEGAIGIAKKDRKSVV